MSNNSGHSESRQAVRPARKKIGPRVPKHDLRRFRCIRALGLAADRLGYTMNWSRWGVIRESDILLNISWRLAPRVRVEVDDRMRAEFSRRRY